uniref:Cytochrome c oxidase subunit 2 n=1 Tax=Bemisia afer TaxID=166114 RepID=A0A023IZ97_BEMAF|nr:cytochrome c oxidase subunit II [Bemisia afer]AHC02239.1 cytochrome oxidase subunit II [Bemisia afer]
MNVWLNLSFQDSASFIMEQMTFFYDFSFLIILMILVFVVYTMVCLSFESFINRYVLDNQMLESVWTVLPLIILVFLAFPSIRILYLMDEMKNPLLSCKVLGHQWFWSYEYSDFTNFEFDSYMIFNCMRLLETDSCFVVPMGLKIRLLVSSVDVLHSWTVPAFGVKVDSIPGRLNQLNFTTNRLGVYFGQCSEICGVNHSFMPIMVEVVMAAAFESWLVNSGA